MNNYRKVVINKLGYPCIAYPDFDKVKEKN